MKQTFDIYNHFETDSYHLFIGNTMICKVDLKKMKSIALNCKFNFIYKNKKSRNWELIPRETS